MRKKIIIYDFDGTLTPYPMPKFEILKKCGVENYAKDSRFISIVKQKIQENNVDFYTAIYELLFETIKSAGFPLTDETFLLGVENIEYNLGVHEFLSYLNNNDVDNYIVSSGIKSYLKNTNIASLFKEIYATEFSYNEKNIVNGIKYSMTDKNKVAAIKEIVKKNELEDCSNVIYVGDGLTDAYAFDYVHNNGGKSIYVYQDENDSNIAKIKSKKIVDLFVKANYTLNSELSKYIINECKI